MLDFFRIVFFFSFVLYLHILSLFHYLLFCIKEATATRTMSTTTTITKTKCLFSLSFSQIQFEEKKLFFYMSRTREFQNYSKKEPPASGMKKTFCMMRYHTFLASCTCISNSGTSCTENSKQYKKTDTIKHNQTHYTRDRGKVR